MIAYIKRMSDFKTIGMAAATSWTLPIASANDDKGKIVLADAALDGNAGNWLIFGGRLFLIDSCTPEYGLVTLSVIAPENAFRRKMIYDSHATAPASIGAFIAGILTNQFKSCTDTDYDMPYLTISNTDETAFAAPPADDNGIYDFADYILSARRSGVWCDFNVSGDTLTVSISAKATPTRVIHFADGHAQLDKQTYNRSTTAKVSVLPENGQLTDFYLGADGSIYTTPPTERAAGGWELITAKADDVLEDKAREVFDKNVNSHQITFYSDREFGLYDALTLYFPTEGKTVKSAVSCVTMQSADSRYYYKAGELPSTLQEQLADLIKKSKEKSK